MLRCYYDCAERALIESQINRFYMNGAELLSDVEAVRGKM